MEKSCHSWYAISVGRPMTTANASDYPVPALLRAVDAGLALRVAACALPAKAVAPAGPSQKTADIGRRSPLKSALGRPRRIIFRDTVAGAQSRAI